MAINDTVLLEIIGTVAGQQHIQTLHFRYDDALSTEADLIEQWKTGCRTTYRACFSTADEPCQLYRARQVCGTIPLRAPVESAEGAGARAGTVNQGTGHRLPSWLAVLTNHRTAFAGPSRRGRSFMGGLYEAWFEGNIMSSGTQAIYEAYWTAVNSVFGASGSTTYTQVIHSHKLASVPGTQCQNSSTIVTSRQVSPNLASMKSRKPGSGL